MDGLQRVCIFLQIIVECKKWQKETRKKGSPGKFGWRASWSRAAGSMCPGGAGGRRGLQSVTCCLIRSARIGPDSSPLSSSVLFYDGKKCQEEKVRPQCQCHLRGDGEQPLPGSGFPGFVFHLQKDLLQLYFGISFTRRKIHTGPFQLNGNAGFKLPPTPPHAPPALNIFY